MMIMMANLILLKKMIMMTRLIIVTIIVRHNTKQARPKEQRDGFRKEDGEKKLMIRRRLTKRTERWVRKSSTLGKSGQ